MKPQSEGNPFTELRQARGMSVAELADLLGIPYMQLSDLDRGRIPDVPRSVLEALARAGHDAERIREQYLAWRRDEQRFLLRLARRRLREKEGLL